MKTLRERIFNKRTFIILGLILILLLQVPVLITNGRTKVKTGWLESYPELCEEENLSITYMPWLGLRSYRLKCSLFPASMDYANPVLVVNSRDCTAFLMAPNLSHPDEYLDLFTTAQELPICP